MAVRLRRMGTMRPLKLGGLWIVPAIYAAVAALMFVQLPPRGWVAIASAVGLAIGAAVGWYRGKMMHISVDPETHALNQKASPAAMMFLIALIAVRMAARGILGQEGAVSPAMLTDPLVAFALGMFSLTRLEMYLRAKRLLEEARRA
jgi:membrane protein CcdC involved in cytochrome C biogenesis